MYTIWILFNILFCNSTTAPDPAKLLEEQRRLEKERNFQLQQERLKQFTVAGKKGSINADNLIDSMFGKFQPKKSTASGSSSPAPCVKINGKIFISFAFLFPSL